MKRIDADGHDSNLFTDGDPVAGDPATVVDAEWLNDVQEELCYVIEQAGGTLAPATSTQLLAAINELISRGGRVSPISLAVVNNQSSLADFTGFSNFLTTQVLGIEFFYRCHRTTASETLVQSGRCYLTWDGTGTVWNVSKVAVHDTEEDDAIDVIDFFATLVSGNTYKLQYKTSNMAGASYVGTVKISDIKYIRA